MLEDNQVKEGTVKEYDGTYGIITTYKGKEYEFVDRDVETKLNVGDEISFFAEEKIIDNEKYYLAHYIRKKRKEKRQN